MDLKEHVQPFLSQEEEERLMRLAKEIFKLMEKENLTYYEAMEVLSVCEEVLKTKCRLGN